MADCRWSRVFRYIHKSPHLTRRAAREVHGTEFSLVPLRPPRRAHTGGKARPSGARRDGGGGPAERSLRPAEAAPLRGPPASRSRRRGRCRREPGFGACRPRARRASPAGSQRCPPPAGSPDGRSLSCATIGAFQPTGGTTCCELSGPPGAASGLGEAPRSRRPRQLQAAGRADVPGGAGQTPEGPAVRAPGPPLRERERGGGRAARPRAERVLGPLPASPSLWRLSPSRKSPMPCISRDVCPRVLLSRHFAVNESKTPAKPAELTRT